MYKLVVIGSSRVGKSALTIQFIYHHFVTAHHPTIEDYYNWQTVVGEELCQINIRDTTGTEEFHSLRDQSLLWGDGFLFVYAVNDVNTLNDMNVFWDKVRRVKDTDRVPMVMVANKVDLTNMLVDSTVGKKMAKRFGIPFVETSAMTGQGVEEAFHELIREIRRMRGEEENKNVPNTEETQGCGFKFCTIM